MTRSVMFVVSALLLLSIPTPLAYGETKLEKVDPYGRPKQFHTGSGLGFAIYIEDGVWHIRTSTRGNSRTAAGSHFVGTVTVVGDDLKGEFESFEVRRRRGPLDSRRSDLIVMHPKNRGFDFHMYTQGKIDTIRFKPGVKAKTVTFDLRVDGDNDPLRILIGEGGVRPQKAIFTLPAHPTKPEKTDVVESKKAA